MSTYLGAWDLIPGQIEGRTVADLVAEAKEQLPYMLAADGAELLGEPRWRLALVMTAPAMPSRGAAPYEHKAAYMDDMMPEVGWRPEWDRVAA